MTCEWSFDDNGEEYYTQCGGTFSFHEDCEQRATKNGFKFCMYCGFEIVEIVGD